MMSLGSTYDRAMRSGQKGATHVIVAPPGNLGLAFVHKLAANKGVMVEALAKDSPLHGLVAPSWLLLQVGGVSVAPGDYQSAEALLQSTEAKERTLKFLDHEAEAMLCAAVHEALSQSWSAQPLVSVKAPKGKLGIAFADFHGKPVVQTLAADSPLRGLVGLRWQLLSVDGESVSGKGHAAIAKLLTDKAESEERVLTFEAEEPKSAPPLFVGIVLVAVLAWCVHTVVANRHEPELTGQMATPGFVESVMEDARKNF